MDRRLLIVRTFFVLLTFAAAGCYNPSLQPCEIACANNACPDGLACNGQNLCAMTSTATCADPPIDAPVDGTSANNVTIEVRDRMGGPLAAALVVFADAAGAQVAEMPTGLDGLASVDLPPGGSATVIRTIMRTGAGGGSDLNVTTYLDLWPGAHVITQAETDQRTRAVRVSFTAPTSTSQFVVHASCATSKSGGSPVSLDVPERCPMFDVIVTAAPASNPTPTHAAVLANQTATLLTIPLSSFQPIRMLSGTLTGLPPTSSRTFSASGWVTPALPSPSSPFASVTIPPAGAVGSLAIPAGVGVATQLTLFQQPVTGGPMFRQIVFERLPVAATSVDRDYSAELMRWPGNPTFDVATRRMAWPVIQPAGFTPTAPSFFMVEAHYSRTADSGVVWKLVGAASRITMEGGLEGISYPDVPGSRTFEPLPTDTVTLDGIALYQVEPQAEHDVIQTLDPAGPDLGYFKIPALRHLSMSIGL